MLQDSIFVSIVTHFGRFIKIKAINLALAIIKNSMQIGVKNKLGLRLR